MENKETESKEAPAYTEQPDAARIVNTQPPPNYTPAQTYQPYPAGPTQPPLYPPMQQQPPYATVVVHTTTQPMVPVGRETTFVRCPSCHADVFTTVQSEPTGRTHAFALLLCLVGCWPCVCVPYCMDSCKTAKHYCPSCHAFVGQHS